MLKAFLFTVLAGSISYASAGDAGCGLGSLVINKNTKMQVFAATTNGTFGSQTFGITSGTSNCSSSGLVKNDMEIQYFVEVNQEELIRDMAQGHGEKITTLAAMNGCTTEAQITAFNEKAQEEFTVIVPEAKTTAVDFVTNLKSSAVVDVCQGT